MEIVGIITVHTMVPPAQGSSAQLAPRLSRSGKEEIMKTKVMESHQFPPRSPNPSVSTAHNLSPTEPVRYHVREMQLEDA